MQDGRRRSDVFANILAALTTSAVALTLGAALGMLSERGAFAGMISAAIFPLVACSLGGTRVKVSGPTAPMSALMAVIVAQVASDPSYSDEFIATILYETAGLLVLAAVLRTGRFIELVPRVVVSGFMTGIGILVWLSQIETVVGSDWANPNWATLGITITSVAVILLTRRFVRRVPGPLMAMLVVPLLAYVVPSGGFAVPLVDLPAVTAFSLFMPDLSPAALVYALPFALQLAFLCYLDTLLTSLVIDIVTEEKSRRDKELAAQGAATAAVALIGGIPGAQATIRSYLIIKEGATQRWAGILVGGFVLVELFALKDLISLMPQAVFAGILLMVGYDVVDWKPIREYVRQHLRAKPRPRVANPLESTKFQGEYVGHLEVFVILGAAILTVLVDLNVAVFVFTGVFFLARIFHVILDIRPLKLVGTARVAVIPLRAPLNVERLAEVHKRIEARRVNPRVVILDFRGVNAIDETGALAVKASVDWLRKRRTEVLIAGLQSSARGLLDALGVIDDVGRLNTFRTVDRALLYAEHMLEDVGARQANTDDCLSRELVVLDAAISSKEALFKFAASVAAKAGYVDDARAFHRDLLFSEEQGSTGLDNGVALPHCRSACVDRCFAMYVRLEEPLAEYATLDGSPVKHVFVIGGTEDAEVYLQLLSRLAQSLHAGGTLARLDAAATPGDVMRCLAAPADGDSSASLTTGQIAETAQ